MTTIELDRNPFPAVADRLDIVGWTKGAWRRKSGEECLHEAIKKCCPVPGDLVIVQAIAEARGHGVNWNDQASRTKDDVTGWCRTTDPISDEELAGLYGPQWEAVVAMVRRYAAATASERNRYRAAVRKQWSTNEWNDAWLAVFVDGGPCLAARRALRAFGDDAGYAYVVAALARRHEIGIAFTQQQYDVLGGPWVSVFGPVHPEDVAA